MASGCPAIVPVAGRVLAGLYLRDPDRDWSGDLKKGPAGTAA